MVASELYGRAFKKKPASAPLSPDNLQQEIGLHRFTHLLINYDHAELAEKLPDFHKDPFDRMLIAQAIIENNGIGEQG